MKTRREEFLAQKNQIDCSLKLNVIELPDFRLIQKYVEDIRKLLAESPIIEQKAFLKSFVKDIQVGKDTVTVNYNLPMPPARSDRDTVGVLPFVTNGRPYRSRTCDTLIKSQVV